MKLVTRHSSLAFYLQPTCLLLVAYCLLVSCTERIDITTDNAEPQTVITGCLTTDTMAHTITVSRTVRYFGTDAPQTFSDAKVSINGVLLASVGDGVYATDSSFYGEPGKKYLLEVEVDDEGNGVPNYYSAETIMPPVHVLDSTHLILFRNDTLDDPRWMIFVNFQDIKNVPNLFGANLYINKIKYSNKLTRYFINTNDEMAADGQYIRFPLISYILRKEMRWDNGEKFHIYTGDTITVELNMLERAYFEYIRSAKSEVSGSNPVFAGPPANVPGNIQGGALGIFGAYTTSCKSFILEKKYGFPERE